MGQRTRNIPPPSFWEYSIRGIYSDWYLLQRDESLDTDLLIGIYYCDVDTLESVSFSWVTEILKLCTHGTLKFFDEPVAVVRAPSLNIVGMTEIMCVKKHMILQVI